jgi:preprotein translocase subunit SecF
MGYEEPGVTSFGTARDVMIRLPVEKGVTPRTSQRVFDALCKVEQGTTKGIDTVTEKGEHVIKSAAWMLPAMKRWCCRRWSSSARRWARAGAERPERAGDGGGRDDLPGHPLRVEVAVAAIIANLHDVVIILGFFAFFQWEFSLTVLAAMLAVLGYSVNESVVIFDRIRENFRKQRKASVHEVIDNAITSTISRTIITHGSTQMMVLSMLIFGGQTCTLRHGADHRYLLRHLLVRVRGGIDRHVAGRQARRPDQAGQGKDETDGAVV